MRNTFSGTTSTGVSRKFATDIVAAKCPEGNLKISPATKMSSLVSKTCVSASLRNATSGQLCLSFTAQEPPFWVALGCDLRNSRTFFLFLAVPEMPRHEITRAMTIKQCFIYSARSPLSTLMVYAFSSNARTQVSQQTRLTKGGAAPVYLHQSDFVKSIPGGHLLLSPSISSSYVLTNWLVSLQKFQAAEGETPNKNSHSMVVLSRDISDRS